MAWSASLLSATGVEANVVATVQFTNPATGDSFQRQVPANDLTPLNLSNYCAAIIAQLNQRDQLIGNLKPGPIA